MQEIKVVVNQDPGKVSWNYEEIKKWLKGELQVYKNTVYTDDTIKTAKTDVAALRKLSKQVKDRRSEIRGRFMEPFEQFEEQVKEIVSLIEEPISAINEQVNDYERRRKEIARAEIIAYWQNRSAVLPKEIREQAFKRIYDARWENATATKRSWHETIDNAVDQFQKDLETIRSFGSEFEQDMLQVYYQRFDFADAMRKMRELEAQKQRILERERQRREAEERRKAEESARQAAQQKIPYEKPVIIEPQKQEQLQNMPCTPPVLKPAETRPEPTHEKAQEQAGIQNMHESVRERGKGFPEAVQAQKQADNELQTITLQITGTANQIQKIRGYISYIRAMQKEVPNVING